MLILETVVDCVFRKPGRLMAYSALLIFPLLSVVGCTGEGTGGQVASSLSMPRDVTEGLDSDHAHNSAPADAGGEADPIITMTPTSDGVTAHMTWDPPHGIKVTEYHVYYRKHLTTEPSSEELSSEESDSEESSSEKLSSAEPSFCSLGEKQGVEAPSATITGLEPNTQYVFAIRAVTVNEAESLCSNEITASTPPAQS